MAKDEKQKQEAGGSKQGDKERKSEAGGSKLEEKRTGEKQEAGNLKQKNKKKSGGKRGSKNSAKAKKDEGAEEKPKTKPEPKKETGEKLPSFRVGDTVKVFWRIREEEKERVQPFEGVVIAKKGSGVSRTFTVRKIASQGVGVERIFPLHSPNIQKLEVAKEGKVRRSKLYYLRKKVGKKATRIKGRAGQVAGNEKKEA